MSWLAIEEAPLDGTDILVRRIEGNGVPPEGAAFVAVAQYWVGLWVFMYAATSAPVQLRFVPTEWQPIDQEWPVVTPLATEENADATQIGSPAQGDAGSSVGSLDPGDPLESGQGV